MKITALRLALLTFATAAFLFIGAHQASAATYVSVRTGYPPPGYRVDHRWSAPYPGAVWIPGYNAWSRGRWVWVPGYYTYPPRRGGHWVPAYYRGGYYYPGRWAY